MKVISFSNLKGGIGKTTTTISVAAALRDMGHRVLLVDLDSQANLTKSLHKDEVDRHVGQLMFREASFEEVVLRSEIGLDLLPASSDLSGYDRAMTNVEDFHVMLKVALKGLKYDFVLLDTAPAVNNMLVCALVAADFYLIPILPDFYSLTGIQNMRSTADSLKQLNKRLKLLGVFLTQYNVKDVNLTKKAVYNQLQESLRDLLFNTTIRVNTVLVDAVLESKDIFSHSPRSNAATDYKNLTNEILTRI